MATTIFGIGNVERGDFPVRGEYRGQNVVLHPETRSLVEEAEVQEDLAALKRQMDGKKIDPRDFKINNTKRLQELLKEYMLRLYPRGGNRQKQEKYKECARRLKRLKQQASTGNSDDPTIDTQDLSDLILEEVANSFLDVTEQDNMIEYFQAFEESTQGEIESNIRQVEKMLNRLSGRTDEKSIGYRKDFQEKLADFRNQVAFYPQFKQELAAAKEKLRGLHGQEIKDGYNLLPKATDLFASYTDGTSAGGDDRVRTVANIYQKALAMDGLVDLMNVTYSQFGEKNWESGLTMMLELCGVDIKSVNPSRDPTFLMSVRNLIYRVITSKELHTWVKSLKNQVSKFLAERDAPAMASVSGIEGAR